MLYVKYYKINIRVIIILSHAQLADNKFYLVLNIYSVNKALLCTRVTPTCFCCCFTAVMAFPRRPGLSGLQVVVDFVNKNMNTM